ncbi:MAG: hypothetical protein QF561_07555 [Phycisphaerales bacterium]|nr:hypothetical protein [Phycisphaerales bacterium]
MSPWTNPPDWLTWPLRPGPLHEIAYDNPGNPDGRWDPQQWLWADLRADQDVALFDWPAAPASWPDVDLSNQVLQPRENPHGGPGTSDTRWLRDIEPQRVPSRGISNPTAVLPSLPNPFLDRGADAFSHWRHLSYIGRPGNGWRMCPDIADATGARSSVSGDGIRFNDNGSGSPATWDDGRAYYGGVVQRTDVPIEQWPAMVPTGRFLGTNQQTRVADNWSVLSGSGFHWGDTATTTFLPETEDVLLPSTPTDMSLPQYAGHLDFWDRWINWLRPEGYKQALLAARSGDGTMLPSNFYDLSDLDGDGVSEYYDAETDPSSGDYAFGNDPLPGDPRFGESAADEFIPGTARWHVGRILTDTDGDGFTDSFWWLSPHVGVDDTRQLVGVSITDNSGRINANVATRFERQDDGSSKESTRGWTPASTALVSQNSAGYGQDSARIPETAAGDGIPVWNTGFFDIESHQPWLLEAPFYGGSTWDLLQESHPDLDRPMLTFPAPGTGTGRGYSDTPVAWNADYWRGQSNRAWLEAMNIDSGSTANPFFPDGGGGLYDIADRDNRLFYFKESGQESQHPQNIFTPFGLSDEFELRAHEGNNSGYVYSRLERALGGSQGSTTPHLLRGKLDWPEHREPMDNRQLASDLRHRMTFYSGARNETRPPHLWWSLRAPHPRAWQFVVEDEQGSIAGDRSDVIVRNLHERFFEQARLKLDLREYERPAPPPSPSPDEQVDPPPEYQPYTFSELLAHNLMLGLTSGDVTDRDTQPVDGDGLPVGDLELGSRDSYFGKGDAAWEKTRRMAAAMAANMIAMRDPDSDAPLYTMEGIDPLAQGLGDAEGEYEWFGEQGAVPLPLFEQAYVPDDLSKWIDNPWAVEFQTGSRPELLGGVDELPSDLDALPFDADLGNNEVGNLVDDFIDLSDAAHRDVLDAAAKGGSATVPPVAPWDIYQADLEWVDPADPENTATYQDNRLFAEHDVWRTQYSPEIHELGVEAQPFISEAFVAVVGRPWKIPEQPQLQPGENQNNAYNEYENAGLWTWATAYEPPGDAFPYEGEWGDIVLAQGPAGDYFKQSQHRPQPPRVVFAVQLVNPYDVPIPLLDEDGQPIYSLNLFRENRYDPASPPRWVIPIDPRGYDPGAVGETHNGTLDFDAMTSIDSANGLPDGDVVWDTDGDDVMDLVPVLPPSTNDRPYSLTIVMNGLDDRDQNGTVYDFDNQPFEAARWLDFLDAERGLHPSSDVNGDGGIDGDEFDYGFRDPYDPSETRWIAPGELIWSVRPNHSGTVPSEVSSDDPFGSNAEAPEKSMPSLAKFWLGEGVGGGVADAAKERFQNAPVDPRMGVGIELVRHHKRDWNGNEVDDPYFDDPNVAGTGLNDYAIDVVIDRTVGPDGVDEFAHAVTTELTRHRQPSFEDNPTGVQPLVSGMSQHFPVSAQFRTTVDGGGQNGANLTQSWLYPRALSPEAVDKNDVAGFSMLDSMFRVPPAQARWMQWARYSRAWAVDDYEFDSGTAGSMPSFAEAEYACNLLDWDPSVPVTSRRWRPDRAAPRFAAAGSRVTRSWAREWAAEMGQLPNLPDELDIEPDGDSVQFPYGGNIDGSDDAVLRVLRHVSWDPQGPSAGPDRIPGAERLIVATEDPLLLDSNLGSFEPYDAATAPLALGVGAPLRLDRRAAEQKGQYSHATIDPSWAEDADDVYAWKQWVVSEPGAARDVRVLIEGDPEQDLSLPRSTILFDGDTSNDVPAPPPPFMDQTPFTDGWGAGWYRTSVGSTGEYGTNGWEMADTYATLLRFRHGHIYSTNWDPDGLGRIDSDGDGQWDTSSNGWQTVEPYTQQNPYPYAWATRNVRLPWSWNVDTDLDGTPEAEYRIYQAAKPCFFGFGHFDRDPGTGVARKRDAGYDQTGGYGAYNFSWSYPDKGWYGPAEIDGDLLMPHGFQVQPKNANFEQVGEVLNALTVAHELYLPLKSVDFDANDPTPRIVPSQWWAWPPDPSIPQTGSFGSHPASGQFTQVDGPVTEFEDRITTLRTFSEGISDRIAEGGDTRRAGRLLLTGSQHGPNAIVGDPYHPWFTEGGDASYDLRHTDFDSGGFGGLDPNAVPHWVVKASDLSHIEPDLPASQRLMDMFVCDGPGIYDLVDNLNWVATPGGNNQFEYPDGRIDDLGAWPAFVSQYTQPQFDARTSNFDNAGGFDRRSTSGMININTAPAEVLRSMPHMHRLVHADPTSNGNGQWNKQPILDDSVTAMLHTTDRPISPHPRSALADAIVQFRDGLGHMPSGSEDGDQGTPWTYDPRSDEAGFLLTGVPDGPPYLDRGSGLPIAWWGSDGVPGTADDETADLDQFYGALSNHYVIRSLADVEADETVRFSRGERGFAGIGELFQLSRPAYYDFAMRDYNFDGDNTDANEDLREAIGTAVAADAWRVDWAARNPFGFQDKQVHGAWGNLSGQSQLVDARSVVGQRGPLDDVGSFLSTDTGRLYDTQVYDLRESNYVAAGPGNSLWDDPIQYVRDGGPAADPRSREIHLTGDRVASDAEEQGLLFSGISNIVTTRSDLFTVHLQIRTFKRDAETGIWDATDKQNIVDDARYVMLVDRSEVDHPGDRPRILMMQRVKD